MKWTYGVPQKMQTAALLLAVMALAVILNLVGRNNVAQLNRSVNSIYNDRLIPVADIFYLSEHLYEKRFVMEKFLSQNKSDVSDVSKVKAELDFRNRSINDLVRRFEQTYLVDSESRFLTSFKDKARRYTFIEQQILAMSEQNRKAEGLTLYETKGKASLKNTIYQLSELTKIQTTVGSQLRDDSRSVVALSNLLSSLQIVLTMIIGSMITLLISSSRIMDSKGKQNSNLN